MVRGDHPRSGAMVESTLHTMSSIYRVIASSDNNDDAKGGRRFAVAATVHAYGR